MMFDTSTNHTEFAQMLSTATDIDDFNQRILAELGVLGFSDYAILRKTPCGSMEIPLSSMPKELIETYQAEKYCRCDMVLDYIAAGNLEPIYLSMIGRVIEAAPLLLTRTFKQNLEILALYERFDVSDAFLIPVKSYKDGNVKHGDGDIALFSVVSKGSTQDEFSQRVECCKSVLQDLAEAVNHIAETRFYPKESKRSINPRPLRLLTTMAKQDLSLAQAANSLCISIDTANKHMALAKKALGTRSQANAVYLAVKMGLIDL